MAASEILPAEREDDTFWWVKLDANSTWEPAHWLNGSWFTTGSHFPWPDPDSLIVGPQAEPPDDAASEGPPMTRDEAQRAQNAAMRALVDGLDKPK